MTRSAERWRKSITSRFEKLRSAAKDRELGSPEDREYIFYKFIFSKKTLLFAFLFWLGLRTFGGHFIYLERYSAALAYFLFVTVMLAWPALYFFEPAALGVLLLLRLGELIYLPFLVKNSNSILEQKLRLEFAVET